MIRLCTVLILSTLSFGAFADEQIQVKGSDTEVNLVQLLAEKFMKSHKDVKMSVTGGGSGTGISALANKTAHLANSSRAIKPEEEAQIKKATGVAPQAIIFATDALTVVVNAKNPVQKLTIDQLGKIYRGEITNWKDVGGKDSPISLYGRQSNSGTFVFFRDAVLKGDYASSMKGMNGNSQIVDGVKQDLSGVGYVGAGYVVDQRTHKPVEGLKLVQVSKEEKGPFFNPLDEKQVLSGLYPIARPLYQYFTGNPGSQLVEFLKYELSPEGRALVKKEGFFDLTKADLALNQKVFKEIAKK